MRSNHLHTLPALGIISLFLVTALAGCAVGDDRTEEGAGGETGAPAVVSPAVAASGEHVDRDPEALNANFKMAVCGRAAAGIACALSDTASFATASYWAPTFNDTSGWDTAPYYSTIQYADLNGDGETDVCGRGPGGMSCALSTGTTFGTVTSWQTSFSDGAGWNSGPQYYSTIKLADVNGDGKADVCGRGGAGIYCALSTGTAFGAATLWQSFFSDAVGWSAGPQYYSTIQFIDLNGDGKADVCGRGSAGIECALSTGAGFGTVSVWQPSFDDAGGSGAGPQYYSTIRFPDINGDGKADVCGRGASGIYCALSNGTSFGTASVWQSSFSDANGWTGAPYYSTLQFGDVNGDGVADLCGRGGAGILCALSNGSSFGTVSTWQSSFSDANGWATGPKYYSTIQLVDLNGDGKLDVCGRGGAGIDCALSNGTSFGTATTWQSLYSDANSWGIDPKFYSTIRFAPQH